MPGVGFEVAMLELLAPTPNPTKPNAQRIAASVRLSKFALQTHKATRAPTYHILAKVRDTMQLGTVVVIEGELHDCGERERERGISVGTPQMAVRVPRALWLRCRYVPRLLNFLMSYLRSEHL